MLDEHEKKLPDTNAPAYFVPPSSTKTKKVFFNAPPEVVQTSSKNVTTKNVKNDVDVDDNLSTNEPNSDASSTMTLNRLNDYNQHYTSYHDYYGQVNMI
jgi:hypothetical protein